MCTLQSALFPIKREQPVTCSKALQTRIIHIVPWKKPTNSKIIMHLHEISGGHTVIVLTDEQSATAAEANISPLILNVWANNIFDPFISIDALDTLQVG